MTSSPIMTIKPKRGPVKDRNYTITVNRMGLNILIGSLLRYAHQLDQLWIKLNRKVDSDTRVEPILVKNRKAKQHLNIILDNLIAQRDGDTP